MICSMYIKSKIANFLDLVLSGNQNQIRKTNSVFYINCSPRVSRKKLLETAKNKDYTL